MKKSFLILAPALFIFSCYVAASDAQGAIVFFFTLPVLFLISSLGFFEMRKNRLKKLERVFLAYIIFLSFFILTAFLPKPFSLPSYSIRAVSKGFEFITGETPFAHEKRVRRD